MATATKTIISNSNTRTVVKVASATAAGADTATITLAGIAMSGQNTSSPKANITKIWYSTQAASYITLTRNGVIVATLYGQGVLEGFGFAENNSSDIDVAFNAGGTVIVELAKLTGYSSMLPDVTGT